MAAQLAWRAWRKLPMQTKSWIGIDDMVEDALMDCHKMMLTKYNKEWSSQSTYLYHHMHKFFYTKYTEKFNILQKRNEERTFSLQAMQEQLGQQVSLDDITKQFHEFAVSADSIQHNILTECFVVPAIEQIYQEGSSRLKEEMVHWFLQSRMKIHTDSKKFRKAAREFRHLSQVHDLRRDDCLHLMKSAKCLDLLSRQLLSVPYDLDNPCPRADRQL
jgi:hypothetical protein